MEEGQKNRFLSKSSIENSQFMTNVVEKKPNIFKRIAMRLSSSNKKSKTSKPQAPKPQPSKKPAPSMPTVPDIAPTAADSPAASDSDPGPSNPSITPNTDLTINETMPPETPASSEPAPVEEPKNVAPIILIKPDRKNPFVTLKDKFDSLDLRSKKLLLIAAGAAVALIVIIIIGIIAIGSHGNKTDGEQVIDPTISSLDSDGSNLEQLYVRQPDAKDPGGAFSTDEIVSVDTEYAQTTTELNEIRTSSTSDDGFTLFIVALDEQINDAARGGNQPLGFNLWMLRVSAAYIDEANPEKALRYLDSVEPDKLNMNQKLILFGNYSTIYRSMGDEPKAREYDMLVEEIYSSGKVLGLVDLNKNNQLKEQA